MARTLKNVRIYNICRSSDTVFATVNIDFLAMDGAGLGPNFEAKVAFLYDQSDTLETIERRALDSCLGLLSDANDISVDQLFETYINPPKYEVEVDLSELDQLTTP